MRRLLAVIPDHPHPLDMGNRVRNMRILQSLSEQFELTIVTVVHDKEHLKNPGPIAELGRWVPILAPHRTSFFSKLAYHLRWRFFGKREGVHKETFFLSFPVVSETVAQLIEEECPDIVHVAYWYTLRHLPELSKDCLWVVDTHDVQFERHARLWGHETSREKALELDELRRYDHVIAITDHDRDVFRAELGNEPPIDVVGMGLDMSAWDPSGLLAADSRPKTVTYYGNFTNDSNQTGARHWLRDLCPKVRGGHPEVATLLLGSGTPDDLRSEAESAGAVVTGFVEDVRPWLVSTDVLALSLRTGSGQRGRVLEVLALGVPVVGYRDALEGLEFADGEGVLIVENEAEFVEAVNRLLDRPDYAKELGGIGRRCVEERYGWSATYGIFPNLYLDWIKK